ncbi:hypothetical protein K1T71_012700 [Dendrolimus kikuchii]|uniref:Uncharacterized protein n=1 Tax=Dendrolimus kikuchii TaxID=765133 RepID=A0ACC1CKD2_9NEOP|nr:hypothetical protein K1T71_012700 [Dendrolimus kikuchii]
MNKLTPAVLSKLRRCFKKSKGRNNARDIDRRVEEVMRAAAAEEGIEFAATASSATVNEVDSLWLDEGGFVNAMNNIFGYIEHKPVFLLAGHHKYSPHSSRLFRILDPFSKGRVSWRQLVGRLVMNGNRRTSSRRDQWVDIRQTRCMRLKHCQRETIVKLVNVEQQDSFCYVAVSKGGRVGVYSGDMQLLHTYEIFYHRTGVRRRVKNCWITDAIYLSVSTDIKSFNKI